MRAIQREMTPDLGDAAADLRHLLNRGYPRDAALQLVGNRYNLDHDGRHLLRRGIFPDAIAEQRYNKRVSVEGLQGARLAIDGHNCVITLESALKGRAICLADDGFVRDIAGVSGGYRETKDTADALQLIMEFLHVAGPVEVIFLLDSPIKGSGKLAARIRSLMQGHGVNGDASAVKVPEQSMAGYEGIIATSDTALIDQSKQVFDLAGHLITEHLRIPVINMKQR